MTNNAVKTEKILKAVYNAKQSEWTAKGLDYGKITFSEFQRILRKNDIATDVRTIKNKWDILEDKDIFIMVGKRDKAMVDLFALSDIVPECRVPSLCTHTDTHTKTEEVLL